MSFFTMIEENNY